MNRDELRAAQEPLKARYREDPGAALHPVSASAVFGEPVTVEVRTAAGAVRAGLHPAAGGDGSDACSGDMLMEALVACAGVTLHAVSVAFGVDLREVEVRAAATFDARGTLGVDRTAPVGVLGPRRRRRGHDGRRRRHPATARDRHGALLRRRPVAPGATDDRGAAPGAAGPIGSSREPKRLRRLARGPDGQVRRGPRPARRPVARGRVGRCLPPADDPRGHRSRRRGRPHRRDARQPARRRADLRGGTRSHLRPGARRPRRGAATSSSSGSAR